MPIAEVYAFFSSAANLERVTPPAMKFRFLEEPPARLEVGSRVRYRIRIGRLPITWVTRITRWEPPTEFADIQEKGPYRSWLHTHTFTSLGDRRTLMHDRVEYELPLGPAGDLVNRLYVGGQLARIFDFREQAFGVMIEGGAAPETWFPPATGWTAPRAGAAAVAGVAGFALVARLLSRRGRRAGRGDDS
jgi:ligand-binding SRPBCC domain-containing protein